MERLCRERASGATPRSLGFIRNTKFREIRIIPHPFKSLDFRRVATNRSGKRATCGVIGTPARLQHPTQ